MAAPISIEVTDLVTEKEARHFSLEEWQNTWFSRLGDRALFISATERENLEVFRKRVYKEVRDIHVTRFPYNNFLYPEHLDEYSSEDPS